MNYLDNIKATSPVMGGPSVGQAFVTGTRGTAKEVYLERLGSNEYTFESLCMDVATGFRTQVGYTGEDVAFFLFSMSSGTYLISSTECDYLIIEDITNNLNLELLSPDYGTYSPVESPLADFFGGDMTLYTGYPLQSDYMVYTTYNYDTYEVDLSAGESVILDYTSIRENIYNDNYRQQWPIMLNRVDMRSYYTLPLSLTGSNSTLKVSFGEPYYERYQEGYASGYSNGYTAGATDYSGTGGNTGGNPATITAFTYIGQAFGAVSSIMALEVLPHITLGLCFSIPLVLVLCMTIFKLVKK